MLVVEIAEGGVVNRYDDDAGNLLALSSTDLEACVDRLLLGAAQEMVVVDQDAQAAGSERNAEQQHQLAFVPQRSAHLRTPIRPGRDSRGSCAAPSPGRCGGGENRRR